MGQRDRAPGAADVRQECHLSRYLLLSPHAAARRGLTGGGALPGLGLLELVELDRDVAGALQDLVDAAPRALLPALQRRAFVDRDRRDVQVGAAPTRGRV